MFVLSFREIPKAKLMSEVLFTIPDTSQGPKYIGKHICVLILYNCWMDFGKMLVKICLIGRPKLGGPINGRWRLKKCCEINTCGYLV